MYDVLLDTDAAPPAAAATESTTRMRWVFGGLPSSSSRSASAPTATIVPMVSKKSASSRVKTKQRGGEDADLAPAAEQAELAQQPEVRGVDQAVRAVVGTFRPQPFGLTCPRHSTAGPMSTRPRPGSPGRFRRGSPIRIAPLTLQHPHDDQREQDRRTKTSIGQPPSRPPMPSSTGTGGRRRCGGRSPRRPDR